MKFVDAFIALNAVTQTPAIRLWLVANKPEVLRQAEEALKPYLGSTDPVMVAASMLMERLDNIIPNLACGTASVAGVVCHGYISVAATFPVRTPASLVEAFGAFAKVCLHESAAVVAQTREGTTHRSVQFIINEDNC